MITLTELPFKKIQSLLFILLLVSACGQTNDDSAGAADSDPVPDNIIDIDQDGFSNIDDCDDNNQYIHSANTFYLDYDLDGFGSLESIEVCAVEPVAGQSLTSDDPDDSNPSITPLDQDGDGTLATSDCNDQDSSLSLEIDYFADVDNDGFGAGGALSVCSNQPPVGYVLSNSDPDDANALIVPADIDGDGVANTEDCNPNDAQQYINQIYYDDSDGDNIGSEIAVNMCVSLPIPTLYGYSLATGDSCPDRYNSNKDFDEDAIDDSCDTEIRILSDKTFSGNDYISLSGEFDGSKNYYFGAKDHPVTIRVIDSAAITVSYNTTLYLEGGSRIILEKTQYNKQPYLSLDRISYKSGRIAGIGHDNKIEFHGAQLNFEPETEFDGIEQILFTTKEIKHPTTQVPKKFISQINYFTDQLYRYRYADNMRFYYYADQAPTIKNSPGVWAVVVRGQTLDVSPIRFQANNGYPIRCNDSDIYKEDNMGYMSRSACQYATYSRYDGNRFNGPLLSLSYHNERSSSQFYYSPDMATENIGTNVVYIQHFSFNITDDLARGIYFDGFTLKAARSIAKDINGDMVDYGLPTQQHLIPQIQAINPGFSPLAYISLYDSDATEVPLIIEGGSIRVIGSKVGTVLFPQRTTSSSSYVSGVFEAYSNSTIDLAGSLYAVTDGINNYGIGIPKTFYGYITLGSDIGSSPLQTEDQIISDSSIHHPVIDISAMQIYSTTWASDQITASNFRITKSVELSGTDLNTVFYQDSSINTLLYLIKK